MVKKILSIRKELESHKTRRSAFSGVGAEVIHWELTQRKIRKVPSVDLQEEIERQERKKIEQQRIEKERAIQEEKETVLALLQDVKNWYKSKQIREYIEAVQEQATRDNGIADPDSELGKWFTWAAQQADYFDPLKKHSFISS